MSKFYYAVLVKDEGMAFGSYLKHVEAEGCPMPDTYFKGRPVYFGNVSHWNDESYFESAYFCDIDEELDDQELEDLSQQECEHLDFARFERAVGQAEAYYEGDR